MNISVIISTYNRCESLGQTLESLLKLECDGSFGYEIIIVNNNSKDQTLDVINRFIPQFKGKLRCVLERKQGLSHARNAGIKEARGDVMAFTDDDVEVDSLWLVNIHKAFKENDCIGIGGRVLPGWPDNQIPWWFDEKHKYAYAGVTCDIDLGDEIQAFKLNYNAPFGANMIYKKEAFEKFGLFNTDLGRKGNDFGLNEDSEFGNRMLAAKHKLLYVPDVIVTHKVMPERLKPGYLRKWYLSFGRSKVKVSKDEDIKSYILGIPRYLFRVFLQRLLNYMRYSVTFNPKLAFLWELRTRATAGQISEYWTLHKKDPNG